MTKFPKPCVECASLPPDIGIFSLSDTSSAKRFSESAVPPLPASMASTRLNTRWVDACSAVSGISSVGDL